MPVPRAQVDSGITIPHGTSPAVIFPTLDGATTTGAHTTASTIPQVPSTPLALMGKRYFPVRTLGEGSFGEVFLVEDRGGVDDASSTTTLSGSATATTTGTGASTFLSSKYNDTAGATTASSMSPDSSARHVRYPLYVIKRLKQPFDRMAKREVDEARAEIASITKLKHPNVVGFHRAWFDAKDYRLHMLLEYCEEGDLHEFMKRNHPLNEELLRSLMVQMMAGLAFIHSQRTMHRDIKLQNVFITSQKVAEPDGKGGFISSRPLIDLDHRAIHHIVSDDDGYARILKIGDFGLSKSLVKTEECAKTTAGTPFHFSPELARRAPYTSKNDVWSMGVAFYYMMTSTMPFQGRTIPEVVRAVISQDLPPPAQRYLQMFRQPIPYSGVCQQLVIGMLRKDPAQRPTASEVLDLAPFFVGIEESRRRRAARVNAVRAQQQIIEARAERRSSQQRNSPIGNNVSAEPSRRTSPLSGAFKAHAIPAPPSRPRPVAVPPTQQPPPASNIIVTASSQKQHHQGIAPLPLAHKRVVQLRFIYSEALVAVRIAPFHGTESVGALRFGDVVSVEATSTSRRGATSTDRDMEPVLYGGGRTPPPPSKNSNTSPQPSPTSIIEQPRWYRLITPVEGFCIAYLPTLSATPPSSNTRRPTSNAPATDAAPLRPLFERTDVSPPPTAHTNPAKQPHAQQVVPILPPSSSDDDDDSPGDGNNNQVGRIRQCELPEMLLENPDDFLSRVSVLIPHSSDDEDGDENNMYSRAEGVFGRGHIGESCSSNDEETSSDDELVIVDGVTGERIHHPDSKIANRTNNTTAVFAGGAPPPPLPQEDQYHFIGGGVGRVVRAPSSGGAEVGLGIVSKPPSPVISRRQSPLSFNNDGKPRSPQSRKAKIVETVTTSPPSDHRKQHTTSPPQAGTPPSTRQSKKG